MESGSKLPATGAGADGGRLLALLRERQEEMAGLLCTLAAAESPSREPAAQVAMLELLTRELDARGYAAEVLPGQDVGPHLLSYPGASRPAPGFQLILGHLDTVWPLGTLERMPIVRRDDRLHGPGVFDMKGGLVQTLFATRRAGRARARAGRAHR